MLELTVTNYCLRKAGRDVAADIDSPRAANARSTISRVRVEILETGHRFNTRKLTLAVNESGRVPIADDYLAIVLPAGLIAQVDSEDGERYVWNESTQTWHTSPVPNTKVVFDLEEFQYIPHKFAVWIGRQAAVEYWSEVNAGKSAPDQLRLEAAEARQKALNSEPLPNIHENTLWNLRRRAFQSRASDRVTTYFEG